MQLYTILPSYVGSKKHWVKLLERYRGERFVEVFAGSAVISFNLAQSCVLNDIDPYICKIIENFDKLIVPKEFSHDDYFAARGRADWWKYSYCFQSMSFSGVFRYSKNGYNVPIKPIWRDKKLQAYESYTKSLQRWVELSPIVSNKCYSNFGPDDVCNSILISDPPYEKSQASYNSLSFDYNKYWNWINDIKNHCKVLVVFDRRENLEKKGIPIFGMRKMTVNGKHNSDIESMAIYQNGAWEEKVND